MNNENATNHEQTAGDAVATAFDIITASSHLANGELDQAETLLCRSMNPPSSCAALDLLARIAVQKGQLDKARQLWQMVLKKDGSNSAAKAALARLDSPWLVLAILKRLGFLSTIAVTVSAAIVGVFALSQFKSFFNSSQTIVQVSSNHAQYAVNRIPDLTTSLPSIPVSPKTEDYAAIIASRPPIFEIPGTEITTNATETRIEFVEGLFSRRCELNESARDRINIVATTLAEHGKDCLVFVVGCTDADPISASSIYLDNYDLGLHRALVVANLLRSSESIPPQDILVSSAGDRAPQFPGDDLGAKLKNRTVIIRLVPKPHTTETHGDKAQ